MNPLSYQVELFALAVFLYLYDSTVLLYANEAILTCRGANRWTASWGWSGFLIAGRTVCLLNPFTPQRMSFRLRWEMHRIDTECPPEAWPDCTQALRSLSLPVIVAGLALFLILPLGMFSALGSYAIITAVTLLYSFALLALVRLYRVRSALQMNRRRFWGLAFEGIACPPFDVNLMRRISLSREIAEPLPIAAARLLDPRQFAIFRDECLARVEGALQRSEEGSAEYRALIAHKEWLSSYGNPP